MGHVKYAGGIVLTPEGGAFVVVEKCPRKRAGVRCDDIEDEWEDAFKIVGAERLTGGMVAMTDTVAKRLTSAPLKGDCTSYIDVGAVAEDVIRLLNAREAYPLPLVIGGEAETVERDRRLLPLRALHSTVTVALEQQRLDALESLTDAAMLIRLLREPATLPEIGPTTDLARAAMIATWVANRYPTGGPWASEKRPRAGTREAYELEAFEMEKRDIERARAAEKKQWWEPADDDFS